RERGRRPGPGARVRGASGEREGSLRSPAPRAEALAAGGGHERGCGSPRLASSVWREGSRRDAHFGTLWGRDAAHRGGPSVYEGAMAQRIDGKAIAAGLRSELREKVEKLKAEH